MRVGGKESRVGMEAIKKSCALKEYFAGCSLEKQSWNLSPGGAEYIIVMLDIEAPSVLQMNLCS